MKRQMHHTEFKFRRDHSQLPKKLFAMDVLEAREAQLRRQLFGADSSSGLSLSPSSSGGNSNSSLSERAAALHTRLEQLYGAAAGFARLNELCTCKLSAWEDVCIRVGE